MARLIDANALKKEIVDFKVNLHPQNQDYATGYFSGLSVVEGMLAYAPTVDAVEVVRCKDCKSSDYSGCTDGVLYCMEHSCYMDENGYCSDGERED